MRQFKRNKYKGYIIDHDNLGRPYIYNTASRYSEDSDHILVGASSLRECKAIINARMATGQNVVSALDVREEFFPDHKTKFIPVCIYCDTTGLYTEKEMYESNLCYLLFPESIVREWFDVVIAPILQSDSALNSDISFEVWYNDLYDADATDGLFDFAVKRGCKITRRDSWQL